MGEDNTPRFIVSFSTQELFLFRRATDGVAVVGSENSVENCRYAMVLTRSEEQLDNELTGGWRVTEVSQIRCCLSKGRLELIIKSSLGVIRRGEAAGRLYLHASPFYLVQGISLAYHIYRSSGPPALLAA